MTKHNREEWEEQVDQLIETNWQRFEGGTLYDVDPKDFIRETFVSKEELRRMLEAQLILDKILAHEVRDPNWEAGYNAALEAIRHELNL